MLGWTRGPCESEGVSKNNLLTLQICIEYHLHMAYSRNVYPLSKWCEVMPSQKIIERALRSRFAFLFQANQSACFGLNWEGHLVFLGATGWFSMGGIEGLSSAGDWNGGRGGFNARKRRGTQKWWCEAQWLADELVFSGEHWPEKWGSISLANPQESSKVSIYSLGYAYACSGVETESFTFTRRGTKAVKWCVLMSLWHPFISPGLNTSVGSLELLCGVSLTCRFECPCDTVHRWVYPWVLKTLRSHGFSNFQCMEAELLPVPIPSPARWPWMLFEPYNQGWNTRNRHKMSLGLGKYWACTLCMYFRKKCWVFYHPLGFCKAFLTSIQICLFGSNLRLPVAIRWGNQDGGEVSASFAWGWDHCCWAACGWLHPGLLLDRVGLQNQSS